MRTWRLLTIAVFSTLVLATFAAAQTVIPVAPFRSVALHDGGTVTLRHGPEQRVTMLSGNPECSRVRVDEQQRLVIENGVAGCRRHQRLAIEVVTPGLAAVSVSHGGTVQSRGAFPPQAAIQADVEQGGRIDIRSIAADAAEASVHSGGGIFISARKTLSGTVRSGGGITYWGEPRVTRSVRHGGFVAKGDPEDVDTPLQELNGGLVPPVPPIPPVPPARY